MRGNITRRGKSSWRLKYGVGTGNQRQIAYVTVRGTKKDAEAELAKRLTELAQGRYVAPAIETVETYARHWLKYIAPAERSPLTLERRGVAERTQMTPVPIRCQFRYTPFDLLEEIVPMTISQGFSLPFDAEVLPLCCDAHNASLG